MFSTWIAASVLTAALATAGGSHTGPTEAPKPGDAEMVEWAIDRFNQAGLELPDDVTVTYFDTTEPCEGNQGTVRAERGNAAWVCVVHDDPAIERQRRQHITLHELGHIWTNHHLDDTTRQAFLDARGADNWNDRTEDWWNRGTEQAAEIMVWGLLDRDPGFQRINNRTCPSMHAGFTILTGVEPLNPVADCAD